MDGTIHSFADVAHIGLQFYFCGDKWDDEADAAKPNRMFSAGVYEDYGVFYLDCVYFNCRLPFNWVSNCADFGGKHVQAQRDAHFFASRANVDEFFA